MRFTHQQPQYDQFQQMSNFFPDQWNAGPGADVLRRRLQQRRAVCSGNTRNAMDPRTGQILTVPNTANTQAAIGTPIPNSGNLLNGIKKAGDGIAKTGYTFPALVLGPRFGMAYDLTGNQTTILRAGGGLYLRPSRRQHDLRHPWQSADRNVAGLALRPAADPRPGPQHCRCRGHDDLPVRRRSAGLVAVERWCPEDAPLGHRRRRLLRRQPRREPHQQRAEPQRRRLRRRLPAAEPGPDRAGTSTVPGALAYPENQLKAYKGLGNITTTPPTSGMSTTRSRPR